MRCVAQYMEDVGSTRRSLCGCVRSVLTSADLRSCKHTTHLYAALQSFVSGDRSSGEFGRKIKNGPTSTRDTSSTAPAHSQRPGLQRDALTACGLSVASLPAAGGPCVKPCADQ